MKMKGFFFYKGIFVGNWMIALVLSSLMVGVVLFDCWGSDSEKYQVVFGFPFIFCIAFCSFVDQPNFTNT